MLNVDDYTFGMPEIERHIHRNLKIPETPANQMRLFRKWHNKADFRLKSPDTVPVKYFL